MATIRVTQRLLVDRVLDSIGNASRRLLKLQQQLATGQRVNTPSDDPLATRRAVNTRSELAQNEQYLANISTTSLLLRDSETAIMTITDIVQRARELTLQGSNGTNTQLQRDQIAVEMNQLLESLLVQGKIESNGRFIFGGTRTRNPPFVETRNLQGEITSVAYAGNDEGFSIEFRKGSTVQANTTGQGVFLGGTDLFQLVAGIRDNLRAGNMAGLQSNLQTIDIADDQLLIAIARIGAASNRIERVDANLQETNDQLKMVLSDALDIDLAEVTLNLNVQSNAFTAALQAGSRVIQPSLLDFVR